MLLSLRRVLGLCALATACSSTPEPASAPVVEPEAAPATAAPIVETAPAPVEEKAEPTLPTACEPGEICTLPADFAERLCKGTYPEVALHLFAPKTPWKRVYVRRAFKAWHVGGRGEMRELRAGEEVIVATMPRAATGGMQIGGQAFDVVRWDGTCVSLMEDELSFNRPSGAVPANMTWKNLDKVFQAALGADKTIEQLRAQESRLCDSPAAEKEPAKTKCEMAHRQLSSAIAQWVGKGNALPPLASIP